MSSIQEKETSNSLYRQWQILSRLSTGKWMGTRELQEILEREGIEISLRTIQRDLNLLEKIFPLALECRRDCMPHNWRWKKVETTIKGLSLSQAVILHLVNKELRDVLPEHILIELNPLFEKAKLITANKAM